MRIVITGLPGTGKTTIAKKLASELKIPLYNIKHFTKAKNVDIELLKKKTTKELKNKKSWILEGHLFCEYKIPADYFFLLRRSEKELREIYKKRKYPPEKIEENIFCGKIHYFEKKLKNQKNVYIIDMEKEEKRNIRKIKKILGQSLAKGKTDNTQKSQ